MHLTRLKILIVDGNTRETDDAHVALGGNPTAEHYARVLYSIRSDVKCSLFHPARNGSPALPAGITLKSFHGIAWTGSALNVYQDSPAVQAQIELARTAFESGVPQFGSCWGLQVAAVAAGGVVRPNPNGRELGIARRITLTSNGREHPMFDGKRNPFDALTVHMDEIVEQPIGMKVLASNAVSAVQAAEIRHGNGTFWGTQYHPEYDFNELAIVILRYGQRLIESGFFADMPTLLRFVNDLCALHEDHSRMDLAWLYGIGDDVLDPAHRGLELKQWLEREVVPKLGIPVM